MKNLVIDTVWWDPIRRASSPRSVSFIYIL